MFFTGLITASELHFTKILHHKGKERSFHWFQIKYGFSDVLYKCLTWTVMWTSLNWAAKWVWALQPWQGLVVIIFFFLSLVPPSRPLRVCSICMLVSFTQCSVLSICMPWLLIKQTILPVMKRFCQMNAMIITLTVPFLSEVVWSINLLFFNVSLVSVVLMYTSLFLCSYQEKLDVSGWNWFSANWKQHVTGSSLELQYQCFLYLNPGIECCAAWCRLDYELNICMNCNTVFNEIKTGICTHLCSIIHLLKVKSALLNQSALLVSLYKRVDLVLKFRLAVNDLRHVALFRKVKRLEEDYDAKM